MTNAGLASPDLFAEATALLVLLQARNLTLATAESCTGGLIGGAITAIPGSSATYLAGFITYSNEAKIRMLGVSEGVIAAAGAVSEACARQMAEGALLNARTDFAISCTGIAGPDGGSAEKPVGLVYIGLAHRNAATTARRFVFPGDRAAVRHATVAAALNFLSETVSAQ